MTLEHIAMGASLGLAVWVAVGIRRARVPKNWVKLVSLFQSLFFDSKIPDAESSPIPLHEWGDLLTWPKSLQDLLERTSEHLHIISIETDALEGTAELLGASYHNIPCDAEVLASSVDDPAARLVIVAEGEQVMPLFQLLHRYAGVRDYLSVVVAVDPKWDQEWIEKHFTHEAMDAEASRQIIYLCLSRAGFAPSYQLKTPEIPPTGWNSICVVPIEGFASTGDDQVSWNRLLALLFNRMGL